ncbi:MAG: Ldh family oxidoreductase [Nitrospinota bacterium]
MSGRMLPEALEGFITAVFHKLGMPEGDANWLAHTLVLTELRGVSSHGVIRLPNYARRVEAGVLNPNPRIRVEKDRGALALMDGDNGMGQIVARRAMEECIARAGRHNVALVLVKESSHFGAAATYAMLAVGEGMAGIVTTTTMKNIAPHGARAPLIGNNPISIALPGAPPLCLDMALSVVARGYVLEAARAGKKIPEGWGLDPGGQPTTDPNEVLKSALLSPIAGHKGSGLSILIDALLAGLVGSGFSHQVKEVGDYSGKSRVAHFFLAIRIEAFLPVAAFRAAADAFCNVLRAAPKAAGVERIWMPGEMEAERERERRERGIPLSPERLKEMAEIGGRLGVPLPEAV